MACGSRRWNGTGSTGDRGSRWRRPGRHAGQENSGPPGGRKAGAFCVTLGEIEPDGVALLCEGWATGASLFECTAVPVVVAFDAGT
jgi:hypothetical protein